MSAESVRVEVLPRALELSTSPLLQGLALSSLLSLFEVGCALGAVLSVVGGAVRCCSGCGGGGSVFKEEDYPAEPLNTQRALHTAFAL